MSFNRVANWLDPRHFETIVAVLTSELGFEALRRTAGYADTVGKRMQATAGNSGTQAGDPVRAAAAVIQITEITNPPRHPVLGAFGVNAVTKRLRETLAEIETWRVTDVATDLRKD